MRYRGYVLFAALAAAALAPPAGAQTPKKCPVESVKVGNVCVDKYEASVWQIAPASKVLVGKVQRGQATLAALTGGGAVQLGCTFAPWSDPDYPANFPDNGNWTPVLGSSPPSPGVYAVSIPGVLPSTCITWFQAEQACALSGKRLATNQEWQRAASGTPDGAPCVVSAVDPGNTGTVGCISNWGTFDMVGNVNEWVADWGDLADNCTNWSATFGSDRSCVGGPGSSYSNLPGALIRGGYWGNGTSAGVFAVDGTDRPSDSGVIGFRCAR